MNKKDIVYMAYEAGLVGKPSEKTVEFLEAFYNLAVVAEREACAIVCDDINAKYKSPQDAAERVASQWCAEAIRARGQA